MISTQLNDISSNIELKNKLETIKEQEKRKKVEYNHLLKYELKKEFCNATKEHYDPIKYLTINNLNIIDKVAKSIDKIQKEQVIDSSGWNDKQIVIDKYKPINAIIDDLDDIYYKQLSIFKNEYNAKLKYKKDEQEENNQKQLKKCYNYIKNKLKANDCNISLFYYDEVFQGFKTDFKILYNYNLDFKDYKSILNQLKDEYKGNIESSKIKQKIITQTNKKKTIPTGWKVAGILFAINKMMKK